MQRGNMFFPYIFREVTQNSAEESTKETEHIKEAYKPTDNIPIYRKQISARFTKARVQNRERVFIRHGH